MLAKDLIKLLEEIPGDTPVVTHGQDEEFYHSVYTEEVVETYYSKGSGYYYLDKRREGLDHPVDVFYIY